MKEIAKNPENRFDAWILKTWRVLPTNPDFVNLTEEQREWLWQDYLLDNPELARKLEQGYDEDFENDWKRMDKSNPEAEQFEEEGYDIDLSTKFNKFVEETNLDDIQRSPQAQAILDQIKKKQSQSEEKNDIANALNSSDWEEVNLDDEDWEEVE